LVTCKLYNQRDSGREAVMPQRASVGPETATRTCALSIISTLTRQRQIRVCSSL
jgi:hypothetical protein